MDLNNDPSPWRKRFLLFVAAVCCLSIAGGIFESTFNNFLIETFNITAKERGALEFPRELPGFLVAVFAGALFFLTDTRMAALAALVTALGFLGLAARGEAYSFMLLAMVVQSAGAHLFMPLQSSIALSLAGGNRAGTLMGRIGGYSTLAVIGGCGIVWLGMQYLHLDYPIIFGLATISATCAAVLLFKIQPASSSATDRRRPRFVWRRAYSLYYVLCILFGARKQVFLTFGPLVLITVFGQPASSIAKLIIVASVLGIAFKPALGWMIDRLGERFVLMADAFMLIGVCLGYGFGRNILPAPYALFLAYGCFVMDMLLFAMDMARAVYLDKIAQKRDDVAPTLTLGVSIDHTVSMSIPALGGLVWVVYGYQWVFAGAAGVALVTLVAASLIRVPQNRVSI
ncbi:MAG: MFS transporter [Armatimonadetes bacterium]|nr:MFS transporter [Armatimonadota bacterium]NIM24772.1 MFS transporter [Armatimonadota bacterium]NIM68661.1 MFS transporter [Armatimonadota bacterium]NIM76958.1 MFS transporter [Armatimonadota bacterium]NIN06864.1 MFS transporter [Armatimonadota bacterium]